MKLTVTVKSGINGDGFNASVTNGEEKVFEQDYNYGYNCSYDRSWADKKAPYVSDVLQDLIDEYDVGEFDVTAGKNVFAGKNVGDEAVERFREKYCKDLNVLDVQSFAAAIAELDSFRGIEASLGMDNSVYKWTPITTISLWDGENETPLTVNIKDENRQVLAYNMLHYMAENGAHVVINGEEQELNTKQLYRITKDGPSTTAYEHLDLDPELVGLESKGDDLHTVSHFDGELLQYAPATANYEKANEMFNFMQTGFEKYVSVVVDDKMIVKNGRAMNTAITDMQGNVCSERFERDWAEGKMKDMAFEDAIASLNPDDGGRGQ